MHDHPGSGVFIQRQVEREVADGLDQLGRTDLDVVAHAQRHERGGVAVAYLQPVFGRRGAARDHQGDREDEKNREMSHSRNSSRRPSTGVDSSVTNCNGAGLGAMEWSDQIWRP